jgi:transcription termination/antitermination protein NusG
MESQWFVIHTLSGQEQKVKENIDKRIKSEEMQDYILQVLIPTEKVSEIKKGKRTTSVRKFFPGYLLVNMRLLDEKGQLMEKPWYFIRDTAGIIGFIGGDRPVPLRKDEVDSLLAQIQERGEKVKPKVNYEVGDQVKITEGPFLSCTGVIEEIDPDRGKLKVSVAIFGRNTPVEVEYSQVERA